MFSVNSSGYLADLTIGVIYLPYILINGSILILIIKMLKHCVNFSQIEEEIQNHALNHELTEDLVVEKQLQWCVQIYSKHRHDKGKIAE